MTQNLSTKTTKLVVNQTKSFSFYGEWMCKHGTGLGSDTFEVVDMQARTGIYTCITLIVTFNISILKKIRNNVENGQLNF